MWKRGWCILQIFLTMVANDPITVNKQRMPLVSTLKYDCRGFKSCRFPLGDVAQSGRAPLNSHSILVVANMVGSQLFTVPYLLYYGRMV